MKRMMSRSISTPQRVLIAPDKFKGTLTCDQAARAILRGLRRAWPQAQFTQQSIADGGEGFADILTTATTGKRYRCTTLDAAGRACRASFGLLGDGVTAVLDLASASGLAQLPQALRDPLHTSSFGTGLVMLRALRAGATTLIVGLGGSATNDGGVGLAQALGYRFLDAHGDELARGGGALRELARIIAPQRLPNARMLIASDVDNPLYGRRGAARQFAAQKGADALAIVQLDAGLRQLANVARRCLRSDFARVPGAGAAGGCGFGLMTFFAATPRSGFDVLRDYVDIDTKIGQCDLLVTGEGSFDRTSLAGKAPYRMAQLAKEAGVPTWGIFGRIDLAMRGLPFDRAVALLGKNEQFNSDADHAAALARAAFALATEAHRPS